MKTAGQILKEARVKKNLKINQIAKVTKILPVYLKALEEDNYLKLPSIISARGFLKNYAEFLGVPAEKILAIFRRDFHEKKTSQTELMTTLADRSKFSWTPKITMAITIAILIILFIFYLIWQYYSLVSAPYY